MRYLALAVLMMGCSGSSGDDKDETDTQATDTTETDATETDATETDATETDADTDADTDSTDVVADNCELAEVPTLTQASGEPSNGETVTFHRVIQACVSETSFSGSWSIVVSNSSNEQVCRFEVTSSSSTTTDDCTACENAFSDVTYDAGTFSDTDLCGLFGIDASFVSNLNVEFDQIGSTTDPDLFYNTGKGWEQLDSTGSTTRVSTSHDDGDLFTLTFDTSYAYGD